MLVRGWLSRFRPSSWYSCYCSIQGREALEWSINNPLSQSAVIVSEGEAIIGAVDKLSLSHHQS